MAIREILKTIPRKQEKGRTFIALAGLLLTVALALLYIYQPTFFRYLENKSYDTMLLAIPGDAGKTPGTPVIVDIDEKSLGRHGQWPWPRYRLALLLDKLTEMGPSSIGLDTVLAEPDRTSLAIIQKEIYRDLKINIPTKHLPQAIMDNDKTLATTLSRGPFVLGYKFTFDENSPPLSDCLIHPLDVAIIRDEGMAQRQGETLFRAGGVICNLRLLAQSAASSGFINATPDFDGVLRRIPLLVEYNGKSYPSLALATLMQSRGIKQVFLKTSPGGVESLRLDHTVVPLDTKGNLLIRYRGKVTAFDRLSASDLLEGRVSKDRIQNRIVFLGSSAAGISDFHTTPFDALYPGVEVHATVIANIIQKEFLSRPGWIPGLELMLIIAAGLISTILLIWLGPLWSLLFLCLGAVGLWQSSLWILHHKGLFLSPILPLIVLGSTFSLIILLKYWRGKREKRHRAKELLLTQDFTIRCLASLTECRDSETGGHILRTQGYVAAVCRQLAIDPKYREVLDNETRDHLYKSSPLHDIGKVGIPDHILLKHGKLTPDEFEEMKKHTTYGRDAIQRAEEKFGAGESSEFLRLAKEIAYTHHERWDGAGYPARLKGEEIPISGRIMALADVYDALICRRVYKPPFTHEEAIAIIVQLKGLLFDPRVVDAFLDVESEFRRISLELADSDGRTG